MPCHASETRKKKNGEKEEIENIEKVEMRKVEREKRVTKNQCKYSRLIYSDSELFFKINITPMNDDFLAVQGRGSATSKSCMLMVHVFLTCVGAQKNQNVTVEQQRSLI
jgi:hypothetical protein